MKKNLLYLVLFALLCVIVFFIFREKESESKIPEDRDFAVENVDEIDKIFLSDRKKNITLTKEGDYWMLNNKHKAMQPKVDVLLETIKNVAVAQPVSKPKWDGVIRELATTATKIEIYRKGEKAPFKVYFVGSATEDSRGTYMIMQVDGKTAEKPYVTHIPGFIGVLSVRYFTDETEWRDTGIFDYDLEEIQEVTLNYPRQPENSFRIQVIRTDSFVVTPLAENILQGNRKIYYPGVLKYLSSFGFLNAEAYVNEMENKDSVINEMPYLLISVTNKSGETKKMTVFYMPLNKRSKLQHDQFGNELPFDLDRYYALINEGRDFVVIQDFVFGKVFRKYPDFLQKE